MSTSRRRIFKWVLTASSLSALSNFKLFAASIKKDDVSSEKNDAGKNNKYDECQTLGHNNKKKNDINTLVIDNFNCLKMGSYKKHDRVRTLGYQTTGVGSAIYVKDNSKSQPSSGNEFKLYDADGNGWLLDKQQKIDAKMLGLVGYGDNIIDETLCFSKILSYSSQYGVKIYIPAGENGYYLLGQIIVPDNTNLEFSTDVQIKARDDLKQAHNQDEAFEVLFRFHNTIGAEWRCNKAKFFYNKKKYSGEHNHIFMFDGASDITIYDANAVMSAGDGFYIGGRFSNLKHCSNIKLIRPSAYQPRRNCLSVISCDKLYVEEYSFQEAGVNGHNSSGPCAGIDVEPEDYTDALNLKFSHGVTKSNLRPGTVISLTKLRPEIVVNISFFKPSSYYDSRGFELTRVNELHKGKVQLINPLVVKSRYASYHGLNCAAGGVLFEIIDAIAVDPSISTDEKYCGDSVYYFNNYNDGSKKDIYPQKIGAVRLVNPSIKYVNSQNKPDYCVRCCVTSDSIGKVNNIQIDNVSVINPLFKNSDYQNDVFNVSAPSRVNYNPFLNIHFQMYSAYQKDLNNDFDARNLPNGFFSNRGASKNIVINLNEPIVGREYNVSILSSHSIKIFSEQGVFRSDKSEQKINKEIVSNVVGSQLHLKGEVRNGKAVWVISKMQGSWDETVELKNDVTG